VVSVPLSALTKLPVSALPETETVIVAIGSANTVELGATIVASLPLLTTFIVFTLVRELMSKLVRLVTPLTVTVAAVSPEINEWPKLMAVIVVVSATVKSVIFPAVVNVARAGAPVMLSVLIIPSTDKLDNTVDVAFTVTARVPVDVEAPVTSAALRAGKSSRDRDVVWPATVRPSIVPERT